MTEDKADELPEQRGVKNLPVEELQRRTNAAMAHMEEVRPEIWYFFLYEKGLDSVLSQFLPCSPFRQVSPIHTALARELRRLNPDLSSWNVSQLRREMQARITDEMISQHLDFEPPYPRSAEPSYPRTASNRATSKGLVAILCALLICGALILVLRETFGKGLSSRDMDWNDDGQMSVSEFFHAFDVGVRAVDGKTCREVYALKDGLPVRELCP